MIKKQLLFLFNEEVMKLRVYMYSAFQYIHVSTFTAFFIDSTLNVRLSISKIMTDAVCLTKYK